MMGPGLGDKLDRLCILSIKDPQGPELAALVEEIQELPAGPELIAAVRLGAVNGRIWTINDWTRKHPEDWDYYPVMKLNDVRRLEVEVLNRGEVRGADHS